MSRSSRFSSPVGTLAGSVLFVVVAWDHLPSRALLVWLSVMIGAALAMHVGFTRSEESKLLLVGHALAGAGWGSVLWLDVALGDGSAEFRWGILAFLFAICGGAIGGLSWSRRLGLAVLIPACLGAAGALAAAGEGLLALGTAVFLLIVLRDHLMSTSMVAELIRLRSEAADAAEEAEWEADHDSLTGLYNRAGLEAQLALETTPHAALFIDLDHFKEVNDRLGHLAGDRVLEVAASRLRTAFRGDDLIARLGGDEFFVVLRSPIASERSLTALGERAIRTLEARISIDDDEAYISASVGMVKIEAGEMHLDGVLRETDRALYDAKRSGRRRAVLFDEKLRAAVAERVGLESALRRAVGAGEIHAWGQPIFDLDSGTVASVELLARWTTEDGSSIPPNVFIPLAEDIGVIDDITAVMLETAASAHARWSEHDHLKDARVNVNVSPFHVDRGDVPGEVAALLARSGLDPSALALELTESSLVAKPERVRTAFRQLQEMGVGLLIDDFGTGFSSLHSLIELPLEGVKVDRSLIAGLGNDQRQQAVIRAVCNLTRTAGRSAVAEGIETEIQAAALADIGFGYGQGYLFCRPMPLVELEGNRGARAMRDVAERLRPPITVVTHEPVGAPF